MRTAVCQALVWLGLVLPVALASQAYAAETGLQVSPLRVEFDKAGATSVVMPKNRKSKPALIQVEVFKWTQQDGKDIHEPTQDVLASPPVFTIPPDGEQLIRLGFRKAPDPTRQLSYRLSVREIPDLANPDQAAGTVRVMIGFSLPIFVKPTAKQVTRLTWSATRNGQSIRIGVHNQGNRHIQIRRFQIMDATGLVVAEMKQMGYVLPSQDANWILPLDNQPTGDGLKLIADTDDGELRADLRLERQ
jgi:fimbrial chaperone protein